MILAIDPGHGLGNSKSGVLDSGAVAAGHRECDIALDWALALNWVAKKKGLKTFMTRKSNEDSAPLSHRVRRAHDAGCTHFLSLHLNSAGILASGTETLFRDAIDRKFALVVHSAAVNVLGRKDRGLKPESASPRGRLAVFAFQGPCCLSELGFITNPTDRNLLLQRQKRVAYAELLIAKFLGGAV